MKQNMILLMCLVSTLSGCFGPVKPPEKVSYVLDVKSYQNHQHHRHPIVIAVATPTASPGYRSRRMTYNKRLFELDAFAKNQWAGPPAELLQPLVVQSLRDSGYFHAVVAGPYAGYQDYQLKINLLELRQDFTYQPSCLKLSIQAELIDNRHRRVLSSRIISASIPTLANTPYAGVIAANRASTLVLRDLRQFCVRQLVFKQVLPKPSGYGF